MDQYWDTYSYCGGDPVNNIDRFGLATDDNPYTSNPPGVPAGALDGHNSKPTPHTETGPGSTIVSNQNRDGQPSIVSSIERAGQNAFKGPVNYLLDFAEDWANSKYDQTGELGYKGLAVVFDFANFATYFVGGPRGTIQNRAPNVTAKPTNQAANRAQYEEYKNELLRQMGKPAVNDPKLNKIVDKLYRDNATVGNGSTAAAVRSEKSTGQPVGGKFHTQKAEDTIRELNDWISKNPKATPNDKAVAENLIRDMTNALQGK